MKHLTAYVLVALFLQTSAWAATTGKIMGAITEAESGTPIPGIEITLKGTNLNATTDADGRYVFMAVAPGMYTLQASGSGHESHQQPVQVTSDFVASINLELKKSKSPISDFKLWSLAWIPLIAIVATAIWYFVVVRPRRQDPNL